MKKKYVLLLSDCSSRSLLRCVTLLEDSDALKAALRDGVYCDPGHNGNDFYEVVSVLPFYNPETDSKNPLQGFGPVAGVPISIFPGPVPLTGAAGHTLPPDGVVVEGRLVGGGGGDGHPRDGAKVTFTPPSADWGKVTHFIIPAEGHAEGGAESPAGGPDGVRVAPASRSDEVDAALGLHPYIVRLDDAANDALKKIAAAHGVIPVAAARAILNHELKLWSETWASDTPANTFKEYL